MKNLILVIVALLVFIGGLGWFLFTSDNPKEHPTKTKVTDGNSTNSIKGLTLREKVVGEYELQKDRDTDRMVLLKDRDTDRMVLLKNGIAESYENGKKKDGEGKWKISEEGELHLTDPQGDIAVFRINKDGSITIIAGIRDGKTEDINKEQQFTAKKIK